MPCTTYRSTSTKKVHPDHQIQVAQLVSLRFLETHRHVCILGPVGVGKTFLASALGHIACRHGYDVKFARVDETLERLRQSRFDDSRDAEMLALTTVDLLILDDFTLEPMTKQENGSSSTASTARPVPAVQPAAVERDETRPRGDRLAAVDASTSRDEALAGGGRASARSPSPR